MINPHKILTLLILLKSAFTFRTYVQKQGPRKKLPASSGYGHMQKGIAEVS